ncbi:hypothetical protein MCAV_05330 [[Mycoplasma] cavipharyngis]|uniref:hypothetical protein n=1 Tax=[Mycoplasma] cavipharyngis TaxID=92757 RepID=UPI003703CF9C
MRSKLKKCNRKAVISFNELGNCLDHHPIIVYYSQVEDEYYYLKIHSTRDEKRSLKKLEIKKFLF